MNASPVYFTDMRCKVGTSLLQKLETLIRRAGLERIDMDQKFVAIKLHFGEPGNYEYIDAPRLPAERKYVPYAYRAPR